MDSDDDWIRDSIECTNEEECEDTDSDGIPDYLDLDSDNDWVLDGKERGVFSFIMRDSDEDWLPDFRDRDDDGDGILTIDEDIDMNWNPYDDDTDDDGIPNYRDDDDDNDGVSTFYENIDWDRFWYDDDTDDDGIPNYLDEDDDNDGILTRYEKGDTDWDSIRNYLDPDDDNDGILTKDEDRDGDGNPKNDDKDKDWIPDYLDKVDTVNNKKDTDKDWIRDFEECPTWFPCIDTDWDWTPNHEDKDSDWDGLLDEDEGKNNTDWDALLDFVDPDDDNDWIPTIDEISSINEHSVASEEKLGFFGFFSKKSGGSTPKKTSTIDSDSDWIDDHKDVDSDDGTNKDSDWDWLPDSIECPEEHSCPDSDGDGINDLYDPDSDWNGLLDGEEWSGDTDWDWLLDYIDTNNTVNNFTDTDGDWILDYIECTNIASCKDTDWDGIVDYLDADDDSWTDTWVESWIWWSTTWSGGSGPHRCPHPFGWYPLDHDKTIETYEKSEVPYPETCNKEERLCQYGTLEWTFIEQSCVQIGKSCTWPDGFITAHWAVWVYYKYDKVVWDPSDGNDECAREWRECINGVWHDLAWFKAGFSYAHKICTVYAPEMIGE